MGKRSLAGIWVSLFLGISGAQATPLTPIGVAGTVAFNIPPGISFSTLGTYSLSGPIGSVEFTASGTPTPLLTAEAAIVPFFFGRAVGMVQYQMEVLGPAGDVPVFIGVSGGVSGTSQLLTDDLFAGFALSSRWTFATTGSLLIDEGITTPSLTGSFSQSFGGTHDLMLTANQVYNVTLIADASARAGSAMAFIDPLFTFGPGVGPEYSFHFSDGIGNSIGNSVPEPSSLTLMAAGMIVIGLCRNRSASRHGRWWLASARTFPPWR